MNKITPMFLKNKMYLSILLIIFQVFFTSVNAQTNTFTATNSSWNTAANWSLGLVPIAAHDVVIPLGKTATVSSNSFAKSISISGVLKINTGMTLTVYNNFTVNSGGAFNMPGGSGVATLIIYGNYFNNGASDFWKSNVIICGDLITPSTSSLQNSGIVVVGGNIIGDFSVTGGTGNIYAVNPDATVTVTPSSIGSTVIPGSVIPSSEGVALIAIINQTIYGGSCPFTITDIADVSACAGSNAIFVVSTSGISPTYQWQVKTDTGWNDLVNDAVYSGVFTSTLTITNINALMDGYKYRAMISSSSCAKSGNFGKLNLTAGPSAPSVGIITQPTCALATGSVVLSGLPLSGILNPGNISYTGTLCTVSGLSPGSYTFTVNNGSCISLVSTPIVIVPLATTTWNGSSWSDGIPSSEKNIVFNGDYVSSSDIYACSCTVNPGANVTVASGNILDMSNAITVTGGTITFENNASLLQTGYSGPNYGTVNVKRNSTPIIYGDYTYWSSPTMGTQTLLSFSPNTQTNKFFTYNNAWVYASPASDTFTKGIGYTIGAPVGISSSVPAIVSRLFTGVPNNGNVDVAVALGTGLVSNRLIGNPYPSAIDANAFIYANLAGSGSINQTISGTLYFWTHNHTLNGNNYSSSDYATYNLTGGTAVATGTGNTATPTSYIASGQGFFVRTMSNGNVSFRNSMRTGSNNTNFYRSANATTAVTTLESHRIWLNLTNSNASFSQALVGYIATATNDFNPGLDGLNFGTDQHVLYSLINSENYTIQGRSLPFTDADIVPLGFKTNIAGNATISIDHVDGLFSGNQNIYLEDQLLNIIHDLKQAPYTFSTQAGTFNSRFVLRYVNSTLGLGDLEGLSNSVTVVSKDKQIKIKSQTESIDHIIIYDILGRQIYENKKVNSNEVVISDLMSHQTLIVKIILSDGYVVTKKLVY